MLFLGFLIFIMLVIANIYFSVRLLQWLRIMILDGAISLPKKEQLAALVFIFLQGVVLSGLLLFNHLSKPMVVRKDQIYGTYRVDKTKFDKAEALWQYENFEIQIGRDHILRLYQLQPNRKIIDSAVFTFSEYFNAAHISLDLDSTRHHILSTNPTLFRKPFHFYYVFESRKFGNMFFKKVGNE
jgi:hypothetical protein